MLAAKVRVSHQPTLLDQHEVGKPHFAYQNNYRSFVYFYF
jgi:hypothetical protein